MIPSPNVTVRPLRKYLVCTIEYETLTLTLSHPLSQFAAKSRSGALPQKIAFMKE